ncbi:MAG TPA: type II secretion system F family protein [Miltoncostaeaceae bacterium]|nr:type II secretion system F family protein [Miltoncostaeaceae bacterium]
MTALASPLVLWIAALACAAMALRVRRPAVAAPGTSSPAPPSLPAPLRLAARLPCPAALVRLALRDGDEARIARAGLGGTLTPETLARARAGAGLAAVAAALPLAVVAPMAAVLAPALGLGAALAPSRWLAARQSARRRALVRELPDLLDLLGICVESGMALDPALELAAGRLGGALGAEIEHVLHDLSLGTQRAEAYRALVRRTGAPELAQTVAALLQAEELGAPLSRALEGQAEALRVARRQAARERAARAAPKIQLVVALLMVPAVLILVLGVLLIELSRQVGAVVGGGP